MKEKNEAGWVEVASLGQDEEATLLAGMLQSAGIPCEVEGPATHPLPENLGSFGVSRVMVPADRLEEARGLMKEGERGARRQTAAADEREE